jgi:hypothetical protein
MLTILLSFLASLLSGLAKSWLAQQQAEADAQQVGANKQAAATESQANVLVTQAQQARDAVKPLTAGELQDIKPGTDPDFRD